MRMAIWALGGLALPASLSAQPAPVALSDLSFLVGDWQTGQGKVADSGETASGHSRITWEAGGHALLRRDHTELTDAAGKPAGSFDQLMMIYPEAGTVHGDYTDGTHIIHYVSADVVAGRSVTFTSASRPDAPTFRLLYALTAPRTLTVTFQMAAPGSTDYHPIATGTLAKAN